MLSDSEPVDFQTDHMAQLLWIWADTHPNTNLIKKYLNYLDLRKVLSIFVAQSYNMESNIQINPITKVDLFI